VTFVKKNLSKYLKSKKQKTDTYNYIIRLFKDISISHEKLRKGSNWNKIISNIKWLVDIPNRNFDITTVFVIQNENYKEIPEFCNLMLREIGVNFVSFLRYDYRSHLKDSYKNKSILLTGQKGEKISEVLKFISKTLKINSKIIYKNEKKSQHYVIKPKPYLITKVTEFKFNKIADFRKGILSLIQELKY